jgi:hypothetical protein
MWSLLAATVGDWPANRAQRLGAALAYYTIFALAPGLIILIAVAGLLFGGRVQQGVEESASVRGSCRSTLRSRLRRRRGPNTAWDHGPPPDVPLTRNP